MYFLKAIILASQIVLLSAIVNAQVVDSSHHVPINKKSFGGLEGLTVAKRTIAIYRRRP